MGKENENIYDYHKVEQALEDYYGEKFIVDKIKPEDEEILADDFLEEDLHES